MIFFYHGLFAVRFVLSLVLGHLVFPDLGTIEALPEAERVPYIVSGLENYSSQFKGKTLWFSAQETGGETYSAPELSDSASSGYSQKLKLYEGTRRHELILSNEQHFVHLTAPDEKVFVKIFDGISGSIYHYSKSRKLLQVERLCEQPGLLSLTFCGLVEITALNTFKDIEKDRFQKRINTMSWKGRVTDPELGDCVILSSTNIGKGINERTMSMYFGFRSNQLVLLRELSTMVSEYKHDYFDEPALEKYSWATDFGYADFSGKTLPKTILRVIKKDYHSLDGRSLASPKIYLSTTTKLSGVKILDRFPEERLQIPIPPDVMVIDRCEQVKQKTIATEVEKSKKSNLGWWLLFLASGALAAAFYFYKKRKL
ncbi:hypothetical protein SH449x_003313 [Pirellulaceae bacterium SH449]